MAMWHNVALHSAHLVVPFFRPKNPGKRLWHCGGMEAAARLGKNPFTHVSPCMTWQYATLRAVPVNPVEGSVAFRLF